MIRIDRSGVPFIAGSLAPVVVFLALGEFLWALFFALITASLVFFFRDPERHPPTNTQAVVAPADGRVLHAGDVQSGIAPPGDWQQVSIFLSPLNVHVNRMPVGGRVTRVIYRPGKFFPAYRRDASLENEQNEIWIDHGGQTVVCRQIVGIMARRIVCRISVDSKVETGQRFGIMKFGSRMDLFTPRTAGLCVSIGDRVRAGETILALLDDQLDVNRHKEA